MTPTREQLEYLRDVERMAALRDLHHSYGWEIYSYLAHQWIDQLTREFVREGLTREEAWEAHVRVRAVTQFQARMDELVAKAIDFVDPASIEIALYSMQQSADV